MAFLSRAGMAFGLGTGGAPATTDAARERLRAQAAESGVVGRVRSKLGGNETTTGTPPKKRRRTGLGGAIAAAGRGFLGGDY